MTQMYSLSPRPQLVQTTVPYARESWPSLVLRLAQCNLYHPITQVGTLMQAVLNKHKLHDNAWWPSTSASVEILATLSHIAARDLWKTLLAPTVSVYRETHAQYCPVCLREALFHRRIWMAQLVAACVEHCCLLVNRCWQCDQGISVADVLTATCSRCSADLRQAVAFGVDDNNGIEAQRLVQSIMTQTVRVDAVGSMIPNVSHDTLVILIHQFAKMRHFATDQQYLHRFDLEELWTSQDWSVNSAHERLHLATQAAQLLYNWPTHFYAFLDLQYARSGVRSRVQQDKESPVVDLALHAPQLQPIREDYHTYVGRTYIPQWYVSAHRQGWLLTYGLVICRHRPTTPAPSSSFTTLELAARQLSVTPPVILHLIRVYSIPFYEFYPSVFVLQTAIDTINQTWSELLSVAETAHWFGLSPSSVEEMTERGLLPGVNVAACGSPPQWAYRKYDVARWIEQVWAALAFEPRRNIGRPHYLTAAAHSLAELGITETTVLWKLVEGELPGFIDERQPPEFASISFSYWDLNAWRWELHDELAANKHWVSTTYFTHWLNDPEHGALSDITSWVEAGLLRVVERVDGMRYFDQAEAEQFTRTYTYPAQAAAVLNTKEWEILHLIAQGRLPTVPGVRASFYHRHLLLRANVERLQE